MSSQMFNNSPPHYFIYKNSLSSQLEHIYNKALPLYTSLVIIPLKINQMSDESIISGYEEEQPPKSKINSKYLNQDKKQQIQEFVQESIFIYYEEKWGKEKKNYYKDDQSQDSEADQEEEIEAEELQKQQLRKQQTDWDVQSDNEIEQIQPFNKTIQKGESKPSKYSQIALDQLAEQLGVKQEEIIKYTKKQLQKQIKAAWPDVEDILKEIQQISTKINKIKTNKVQGRSKRAFNQVQLNLLTGYMATLLFYVQLRSQTKLTETHPIFKKIVEIKTKIEELKEVKKHAELIDFHYSRNNQSSHKTEDNEEDSTNNMEEIQTINLKQKIKDAHQTNVKNKTQQKVQNILEQMDDELSNKKRKTKEIDQQKENSIKINMQALDDSLLNDDELGEDEFYTQNKAKQKEQKLDKKKQKLAEKQEQFQSLSKVQKLTEVKEDDPRKINYVMLKNISLMRRRRGNRIKNSRVKHKLKYEKAIKKLKSQNKFMKDPIISNYSGENGVKSGIIRGVRLQ